MLTFSQTRVAYVQLDSAYCKDKCYTFFPMDLIISNINYLVNNLVLSNLALSPDTLDNSWYLLNN